MDDDFNIFYRFNSDTYYLEILPVAIFNRQDGGSPVMDSKKHPHAAKKWAENKKNNRPF